MLGVWGRGWCMVRIGRNYYILEIVLNTEEKVMEQTRGVPAFLAFAVNLGRQLKSFFIF